jgi:hypothetical protein
MARSRRKTPIAGVTSAESEKQDKAASHRVYRRTLKQVITPALETPLPTEKQLTNPWSMAKEGKSRYDPDMSPKRRRK